MADAGGRGFWRPNMLRLDSEVNLSEAAVGALEALERPARPPANDYEAQNHTVRPPYRPPAVNNSDDNDTDSDEERHNDGHQQDRSSSSLHPDNNGRHDPTDSEDDDHPLSRLEDAANPGGVAVGVAGGYGSLPHTPRDQRPEADFDHTFEPQHMGVPAPTPTTVRSPSVAELDAFVLKYVTGPIPMGQKLLCRIIRRKDGVEKLYPRYELYIEDPDNSHVFLLSARKRKKSSSSYYVITTIRFAGKADDKASVVAKVRSNFVGTAFTIYGSRNYPVDAKPGKRPMREELGMVLYDPNLLGFKGPRKMTVVLPSMTRDGKRSALNPVDDKDTLAARCRAGNDRNVLKLHNKAPQWNDETQSFVLNFNGRVTLASVKNFQIVHDNDLDYIILQFGRVSEDTFTIDFQYPMSCVQAFAIALTSFDAKLLCE